eukprot:jgi/Chrzof1/11236/Cz05g28310.t1
MASVKPLWQVAAILVTMSLLSANVHVSAEVHSKPEEQKLPEEPVKHFTWDGRNIAGIVLGVLVSLTSCIDRECGSTLFLVLFSVLLGFPMRRAVAFTALTVFLGSLGPGISAMSEAVDTERGVLALVDYPALLVLLPTMYYGLSFGVIINAWLPNWMLILLVAVGLAINCCSLLYSWVAMRKGRTAAINIMQKMQTELAVQQQRRDQNGPNAQPDASGGGLPLQQRTSDTAADTVLSVDNSQETLQLLWQQLLQLKLSAEHLEAIALLYPALHVRDVVKYLKDDPNYHSLLHQLQILHITDSPVPAPPTLPPPEQELPVALKHCCRGCSPFCRLQNHFEIALVCKVVIIHMITEFMRHEVGKPCTPKFWFMLVAVTGTVTVLMVTVIIAYSRAKLWRGPAWKQALQQVQQQQAAEAAATPDEQRKPAGVIHSMQSPQPQLMLQPQQQDADLVKDVGFVDHDPARVAVVVADDKDVATIDGITAHPDNQPVKTTCAQRMARLKQRMPWTPEPAYTAITNPDPAVCVSTNQYQSWTKPFLISTSATGLVLGGVACCLGMPAGASAAWLMLKMGMKPHVVAGSSRCMVMFCMFGVFIAYIISGNLQLSYALAYGALNLVIAPVGLLLFRKLRLPSIHLVMISAAMAVAGLVVIVVCLLGPALRHVATVGVTDFEDAFSIARFCHNSDY